MRTNRTSGTDNRDITDFVTVNEYNIGENPCSQGTEHFEDRHGRGLFL